MVRETRHLWVGNLPHAIREERIHDHFKRYGKVQSVKILPKKDEEGGGGCSATVAFIDIKSAAKAHNADNKIDERTLKTDYYEPPASSTASSAIFIHERDDALVGRTPAPPPAPSYTTGRNARYGQHGLSEDRNYERPGHYYERVTEREPYLRRPMGIGYHEDDNYQGRAKSRDRYVRSTPGNTYTEGTERNQNHFRAHNTRQHFDQTRYSEQYNDERDVGSTTPRVNRRTSNASAAPAVPAVATSPLNRSDSRSRRTKRRSPSQTPSGSRSNSASRSRSTSRSRSSSSSSKLRSSSSDSSGRSRSPSKSRSPATSYGSQSNAKGNRLERPASAIANPSNAVSYLPSSVSTSAINCTPVTSSQRPPAPAPLNTLAATTSPTNEISSGKEEKKPLGICVRNLPVRSTDTSLKDGLFHEYKKHGKVTMVKVIGQGIERYAVVCFKKPEDVEKALEVSKDKLFFGCKIEVTAHEGLDADDNEFRPLEAELDEFHPKATRTLFIGNLEKEITTVELRKHFEQFGEIIEIDIKKQGTSTSYAFIQYSDIASVVKAMRKLDGENLGANRIKLGFGKSMPTNCVWLDGIVDTISEKFLSRHFSRFGMVSYCAIDKEKGHALLFYDSIDLAQIAVSEMRGRILGGKKLQVDFASRECQTTFFDKLEMTGQMVPGDRPWERRERRAPEFELVRGDDRDSRVNFENRLYPRYDAQTRVNRGAFRGMPRANFTARGRGQNFPSRYEMYYDELGERRHRYGSREESVCDNPTFDNKVDRLKYEPVECPNRKRNKLRNSISDQESHHSQSPPRSRHQSRSTSPVSKDRKPLKERLHHRMKSPESHNSSQVSSPCHESLNDDLLDIFSSDYKERLKNSEGKLELGDSEIPFPLASPKNSLLDGLEKASVKLDSDSFRRRSIDSDLMDDSSTTSEQLSQLERKKRLLAATASVALSKDSGLVIQKPCCDRIKQKSLASHSIVNKVGQMNCTLNSVICDEKHDGESGEAEASKDKPRVGESANTDLKYLQKKQVHILHLLEQLHEGHSSDTEGSLENDRFSHKKKRSLSSSADSNMCSENDISKALTKEECNAKLLKSGLTDHISLSRTKSDNADGNNCFSLSLDSFIFRKHLDPRKMDPHTLTAMNSLQKYRRISIDKDDLFIPNAQESYLCVPSSLASEWKKQCSSLSLQSADSLLLGNDGNDLSSLVHSKNKDDSLANDICLGSKKITTLAELSKSFGLEIKRERDLSPLSLPLPKFAATLRSPKSSPSIVTSPKGMALSPRAVHSPSSNASIKNTKTCDVIQEMHSEKKPNSACSEERVNGLSILSTASSPTESQVNSDLSDFISCLETIQSPKANAEPNKESNIGSSDSDLSPVSSPNRPSIEDRIKALDEKFNAWSGSARTVNNAPENDPAPIIDLPKCNIKKRSRFNFLAPEIRTEPSEIVKSLLAKSTIFDQDSQRLQHIDEKYEPMNIKMEVSPKAKPTFRTKAAAKEFSSPITSSLQTLNNTVVTKPTVVPTPVVASPPTTPHSAISNVVLSPVTPPTPLNPVSSQLYTPCSPHAISFVPPCVPKVCDDHTFPLTKDSSGVQAGLTPKAFNSVKVKSEVDIIRSTSASSVELLSHGVLANSLPVSVKKESSLLKENIHPLHMEDSEKSASFKKECAPGTAPNIPPKKDYTIHVLKDQTVSKSISSVENVKKEPLIPNNCHWEGPVNMDITTDTCTKNDPCSSSLEGKVTSLVSKKRMSSIDSLESTRDVQEASLKQDRKESKAMEPECKKPKLSVSKSTNERSPAHGSSAKKKDKISKSDKQKSGNPKPNSSSHCEKEEIELAKSNAKHETKEKLKFDCQKIKEEKKGKYREENGKNEARPKSNERKNSEKDSKSSSSSSGSSNSKKKDCSTNRSEKSKSEKKTSDKKPKSRMKSDFEICLQEEPVYFSMYDKVKARSSKTQTLKHQAKDLESMRKKFTKLKQSRAKREEKSRSIDHDSDKDSDSASHHSSDSDTHTHSKSKQQRKRKLVIESSSEDDTIQHLQSRSNQSEKYYSDSESDSEFEQKIHQKQKNRKKKSEVIESDSSNSGSHHPTKSSIMARKKPKSKFSSDKSKKIVKSDDDISDNDALSKWQAKEKEHKKKKVKKYKSHDIKTEKEIFETSSNKKSIEDIKASKKKSHKDDKETTQEEFCREKFQSLSSKEEKDIELETLDVDESEKLKSFNKKRKKSKKTSKLKEKRPSSDRRSSEHSSRKDEESEYNSSLPTLMYPSPNSPSPLNFPSPTNPNTEEPLSPPCLQVGDHSMENDFKSDISDFDFEQHPHNVESSKQQVTKNERSLEKSSKSAKKRNSFPSRLYSENSESEFSHDLNPVLPTDKMVKLPNNKDHHFRENGSSLESNRKKCLTSTSPIKKNKEMIPDSHHKVKHERSTEEPSHHRHTESRLLNDNTDLSKEERRKKKMKRQSKEKRWKPKEDESLKNKETVLTPQAVHTSTALIFDPASPDGDSSRLSDIRLDEEIAEEARRLEQELLAASEETSTFGDEGPTSKKEEKPVERRFEEEAAKETRRLEAELLSTGRESWHMKEKPYGPELLVEEICSDGKPMSESDELKDENLFASIIDTSQDNDLFMSGHTDSDQYKLEDKDVVNEIDDQRKIEDDLAVSALLQEMNSGDISAPELTKETDYLEPLMTSQPDDTMNYLLPDESSDSLHIVDNSPELLVSESQSARLDSADIGLSPSSNSEPPALEISNFNDPAVLKDYHEVKPLPTESSKTETPEETPRDKIYDSRLDQSPNSPAELSIDICENKPPVIDIPSGTATLEDSMSPQILKRPSRKKWDSTLVPSKERAFHHMFAASDRLNLETDEQHESFEDITMDIKDDDNPPILLPVDLPQKIIAEKSHLDCIPIVPKVEKPNTSVGITSYMPSTTDSVIVRTSEHSNKHSNLRLGIFPEPCTIKEPEPSLSICLGDLADSIGGLVPLSIPEPCHRDNKISSVSPMLQNSSASCKEVISSLSHNSRKWGGSAFETEKVSSFMSRTTDFDKVSSKSHFLNYPEIFQRQDTGNRLERSLEFGKEDSSIIKNTKFRKDDTSVIKSTSIASGLLETSQKRGTYTHARNLLTNDNFLFNVLGTNKDNRGVVVINTSQIAKHVETETSDNSTSCQKNSPSVTIKIPETECPKSETATAPKEGNNTCTKKDKFEPLICETKTLHFPPLFNIPTEPLPSPPSEEKPSAEKESDKVPDAAENKTDAKCDDLISTENVTAQSLDENASDGLLERNNSLSDLSKIDLKSEGEDSMDKKSKSADAESVSSDTTDIAFQDIKTDLEISQLTSSEEQLQEDTYTNEELEIDEKQKNDRPRRGRRPKTRKYSESIASFKHESSIDSQPNVAQHNKSGRRSQQTTSERSRRSLRNDVIEIPVAETKRTSDGKNSTKPVIELDDISKKGDFEECVIDNCIHESDTFSCIEGSKSSGDVDTKSSEKVYNTRAEESRRRRGRKKKSSGDANVNISISSDKGEIKPEDSEHNRDAHRPKESRIWLNMASDKDHKSAKDSSNAYDVFEFRDSEEEELAFDRDLQTSVKERLHDTKPPVAAAEPKVEPKLQETILEKEKKIEEPKPKSVVSEEREPAGKETVPEVNQHPKISITIRLLQKDGQDGTSTGTAEVVKTSEALNIDESKPESSRQEKNSSKEPVVVEPSHGPCKSTRKSTRLMNQAARSTYDEVIEDVVKGKMLGKTDSLPSRVTRRSRSSRKSEESASSVPSEGFEDAMEDKNKHEPMYVILDNTVKDVPDSKKVLVTPPSEGGNSAENTNSSEPDRASERIASLRSFRIARSNASKLEAHKEASSLSTSSDSTHDGDLPKKDSSPSSSIEEKSVVSPPSSLSMKDKKDTPSAMQEQTCRPPLPVLKVELSRAILSNGKEAVGKAEEPEEDSDSRSSPAVILDPVTGILTPVCKTVESPVKLETSDQNKTVAETSGNVLPPNPDSKSVAESASKDESLKISKVGSYDQPSRINTVLTQSSKKEVPAVSTCNIKELQTTLDTLSSLQKNEVQENKNKMPQTCAHIGVLTPVTPIVSHVASATSVLSKPASTNDMKTSGLPTVIPQSPHLRSATSSTISNLPSEPLGASAAAVAPGIITAAPASYQQTRTIVTAVVTVASTELVTSHALKTQARYLATTDAAHMPKTSAKTEALNIMPPTPSSDSANHKAISDQPLATSSSHQSSAIIPKEGLLPLTSVVSTWSNTKPVSGIISSVADMARHSSAVQNMKDSRILQTPKSTYIHAAPKTSPTFHQQAGYPLSGYDTAIVHPNLHSLAAGNSSGVIAELLQNPQLLQQHKEFLAASSGQFQERSQSQLVRAPPPIGSGIPPDVAARLGNPTPPHTPTPPVTSSGYSLQADMHSPHIAAGLHLRHSTQPPSILPTIVSHPSMPIHPSHINAYVHHQQMMYSQYPGMHPDIRAQPFAYPSIPHSSVSAANFRPPPDLRMPHSSSVDAKSDGKSTPEEEKAHYPIKPIRIKKEDKELKIIHSEDHERPPVAHDKHPSTSAMTPQGLRQHPHYATAIRQHMMVPSHEQITDSPVVSNLYTPGQGRMPVMPVVDGLKDPKCDTGISLLQSHHSKPDNSERELKPPLAHQAHPSTLAFTRDASLHPASRQQLSVVSELGSSAPGYIDVRPSNQPSPSAHIYKKDILHPQGSDKRGNQDAAKKVHMKSLSHQGSSVSPGPAGLQAHSPHQWPPVIQAHHSVGQPSHHTMTPGDQQGHRAHFAPLMGTDIPVHVPSPANAMAQSPSIPRTMSQTPPHGSQVPQHSDAFIIKNYPVIWQGLLALKNDQAAVQMHYVYGNGQIAVASLPPRERVGFSGQQLRVAQRMRLDPAQLEGVAKKMQMDDEHCILVALPCGKDHTDVVQQSQNLRIGFIKYLLEKQAAGIVNAAAPGSQQPAYVIHIFPSCDFSDTSVQRKAPLLTQVISDSDIPYLVIIIATV